MSVPHSYVSELPILSVVKQLSFCRDIQQVMEVVKVAARTFTQADGVTFVLREGKHVYYAEENAIAPLWKGRRFPATECISGCVMLNGEAAIIEDIYQDPRIPCEAYRPTFVKSLVMMPVRAPEPIAAIGAYWAAQHRATEHEVSALQTIADATALALQNVQLYTDLQMSLERERAATKREHKLRVEAETASREKDQWLSVLSHELRTPLTPVLGWLHLLQRHDFDESKFRESLEVIQRNLKIHARLIEDLIDVSRLITRKFALKHDPFDLDECMRTAVEPHRIAAEAKGVSVKYEREGGDCHLSGDCDRIAQVVRNLVDNAIKFTPRGGSVTVKLACSETAAEICVVDTGTGIAPELIHRVFDRFQQVDGSATRAAGGLGLGLWIVREIVELHNGTIEASSDGQDKGCSFIIRLPLNNLQSAAS